jgi:hypothetical protein
MADHRIPLLGLGSVLLALAACSVPHHEAVRFDSPQERQVFQRGLSGWAEVSVEGTAPASMTALKVRARLADGRFTVWSSIALQREVDGERRFGTTLAVPSGGWYELQWRDGDGDRNRVGVRRFGVGEVFVVAGQSNSTNCGDPSTPIHNDRVSAFDGESWRHAHDPMPGVQDHTTGGSPWPRFADLLQRSLRVPVAIASVGHGDSSILDWQPGIAPRDEGVGKALYPALRDRLSVLGYVRAVLWHQGETDAREGLREDEYVDAFVRLVEALRNDTGSSPPWLVARVSFLPRNRAAAMREIRNAHERLWAEGYALRGPDTDDLQGVLRAGDHTHFSRLGLEVHAERWFAMVWSELFMRPGTEAGSQDLLAEIAQR